MSWRVRTWSFINSDLGRLLLGFLLTTVIGGALIGWYQQRNWERQKELEFERQELQWERDRRFEMLRRRLDYGEQALEAIADLMDTRVYRLRDVFAAIAAVDVDRATEKWRPYMESVERWNETLGSNRSKLVRLVSKEAAAEFNNYETDRIDLEHAASLHGKFFIAHRQIERLFRCLRTPGCVVRADERRDLASQINEIDFHTDDFVDKTTADFLARASKLERDDLFENGKR